MPPLRVAKKNHLGAHVPQHVGRDFSSKGTFLLGPAILGAENDIAVFQIPPNVVKMNEGRENDALAVCGVALMSGHISGKGGGFAPGEVHFPVSGNDRGTRHEISWM